MKADSGATGNYVKPSDSHVLKNITTTPGPKVMLPYSSIIQSNQSGTLPIPGLSEIATRAHIYNDLHSLSLLSVGRLCNDDCLVLFDKQHMKVFQNNKEILRGDRNHQDGLWDVNLSTLQQQHKMNVIIKQDATIGELIHYFQGCCFSPTKSTFLQAVKNGNFITWPGLNTRSSSKALQTECLCGERAFKPGKSQSTINKNDYAYTTFRGRQAR